MLYNTDTLMLRVYQSLFDDMHRSLGLIGNTKLGKAALSEDIAAIRENSFVLHENLSITQFKWCAQMNSFLKRYTFQTDLYSPDEREKLTNEKFIKLQENLAQNYWRHRSIRCHEVLRKTRQFVRQILDGFEPQGNDPRGQFGTKATVGCPASDAYIDQKLIARPLTGSKCHLEWFKSELLANDPLLALSLKPNKKGFVEISSLVQVNVPKKFSIDRGINPNTLVGSSYSMALGRIVEDALTKEGLNIRRQQHRHGILAKKASTNGRWATADLSDASHGFLSHLLNAVMPRKWYRAIMFGAIRSVEVAGKVYRLESIMTMGIGFTFPIQTLLFYCLLKAISSLSGVRGLISVYGDDLIYPVKLHRFVVAIFQDLGFKLNLDKTFVQSSFKESCGSDYFKGEAVRPFSPEGRSESLGNVKYAAFCYKILNGLLRRWDYDSIKSVVHLLCEEICRVKGVLYIVPVGYPDHSGLKLARSEYYNDTIWFVAYPSAPWVWDPDTFAYNFPSIQAKPRRRYVKDMTPYYWDCLRRLSIVERPSRMPYMTATTPLFKWRSGKRITFVIGHDGRKRRRKYATVDLIESSARYTVTPTRVHTCTEGIDAT